MNANQHARGLLTAFALVTLAYILALGVAILVCHLLSNHSRVLVTLASDIAATCVIFLFGRVFHNSSFYDPYWSLAPIAISIYWAITSQITFGWHQFIILTLVFLWGLRLTWHWAAGWRGLKHEDWRYSDLRKKTGGRFWLVELLGIDLMPTLVVFLGCLSLYPALTSNQIFGALDVAAIVVTGAAIVIESVADEQLNQFIKKEHTPAAIMSGGLWSYSRHPNYLGEITFWWGLYLFALAGGLSHWWAIIGPLAITALFIFVSVPMMDQHLADNRPDYADLRLNLPALFPRLVKNRESPP